MLNERDLAVFRCYRAIARCEQQRTRTARAEWGAAILRLRIYIISIRGRLLTEIRKVN